MTRRGTKKNKSYQFTFLHPNDIRDQSTLINKWAILYSEIKCSTGLNYYLQRRWSEKLKMIYTNTILFCVQPLADQYAKASLLYLEMMTT